MSMLNTYLTTTNSLLVSTGCELDVTAVIEFLVVRLEEDFQQFPGALHHGIARRNGHQLVVGAPQCG